MESIAFPCISTGVYGYPKREAAEIALAALKKWTAPLPSKALIVVYDREAFEIYAGLLGYDKTMNGDGKLNPTASR